VDSRAIAQELQRTLLRYRAGLINGAKAKEELAILQTMLKAYEQAEIEEKLARLEAVLEGRRL
jgi:3-deoxy-D-arabino-heptulosonate 7-phosphate (DAHP) synthase class II